MLLKNQIKISLQEIKKEYATPRRTEIKDEVTEIKIDAMDMIPKENVIVVSSKQGYVKRVPLKSYSAANGEETGQQQTKENIRFQKGLRRTAGQAEDGPLKGALAERGSASGFV